MVLAMIFAYFSALALYCTSFVPRYPLLLPLLYLLLPLGQLHLSLYRYDCLT